MAFHTTTRFCKYCNKIFHTTYPQDYFCSISCRFWSKVNKKSINDCWIWKSYCNKFGYGSFYIKEQFYRAHRIAYSLKYGKIPKGIFVLHRCDNPSCVNPNHLFLGTQSDNMRDASQKSHFPLRKGIKNSRAKLTENDIKKIRQLLEQGMFQKDIGNLFGITQGMIGFIKRGLSWNHIH